MKVFLWRHNRRLHSWSMINEPNVHQSFYTDAVAVVQADSPEEALRLLAAREPEWVIEELQRLEPKVFVATESAIIFADVRGD
ncbi:hypothetical protein [Anaeroselena agilis]|uniref:Uncharacterized protein n=1 Tax=Anaeroselena agilis TaxID=3063788 RepID=A0ABU3P307_9FIRM|nr:hypothetical protein [Selenomonadales bacterium 4137-cl]